jgi:hypothetical protein
LVPVARQGNSNLEPNPRKRKPTMSNGSTSMMNEPLGELCTDESGTTMDKDTTTLSKKSPSTRLSPPKRKVRRQSAGSTHETTLHKKKKPRFQSLSPRRRSPRKSTVQFSPNLKIYKADDYDRTQPELNVFDCDGCSQKILQERYTCTQCDYDLCATCAPMLIQKHKHDAKSFRLIPPDEEDN